METIASRQLVVMACERARRRGVRAGMTLAEARALCPNLEHAPHEPQRDRRALEALGRWMMRFSPVVAIGSCGPDGLRVLGSSGKSKRPSQAAGYLPALFLDVTGCQRLFGGLPNLIEQVHEVMQRFGLNAQIAIAPTPGAAWAIASAGRENGTIVPPERLGRELTPLPPSALRLEVGIIESLYHLGIETIGQLMQLPRQSLPARFGPILLTRLDQALGRIAEPLVPLIDQPPIEARMDFEGTVDSLEAIWMVFKDLIGQVIAELKRRGQGARKLELQFFRAYGQPLSRSLLLSRPSRDAVNLFNLMRCVMEGLEEEARRHGGTKARRGRSILARACDQDSNAPAGFTGIRLAVPVFERLTEEQILLLEQEEHTGQIELARLIERLVLRLGEEGIVQTELIESHLPERAVRMRGAGEEDLRGSDEGEEERTGESANRRTGEGDASASPPDPGPQTLDPRFSSSSSLAGPALSTPTCAEGHPPIDAFPQIENRKSKIENPLRPLHLLPHPLEIAVMVAPSHDRDGRPISITQAGRVRRVVHALGPERIAGQWWEGHTKTRDYFAIEDEAGQRNWIFRVQETGKWYVHGNFA